MALGRGESTRRDPGYSVEEIDDLLTEAKRLAKRYRVLTGKPLGITGEVAEVSAAKLLGLSLAEARQSGFDALREEQGKVIRLQVKGRCLLNKSTPGQRVGNIRLDHEWDAVLLVLMDQDFEVLCIYEATREEIKEALLKPGSKARNERGALSVSKFKSIGQLVWEPEKSSAT